MDAARLLFCIARTSNGENAQAMRVGKIGTADVMEILVLKFPLHLTRHSIHSGMPVLLTYRRS
jgi:hypothetical protein